MDKKARKKSTDPVQEALRTHKDKWNQAAKEFIDRMISFKRGLNGRGDPKYGLPPGSIKDPLPGQVVSFLSQLASNFEQLASEAERIEQEQASYSEHRRKPKEAAIKNNLVKTASKKAKVCVGEHEFPTLIAITSEEQSLGLMNKPWPPPVMSFIYAYPQVNNFWMKNTPSPLDIVFSVRGIITKICKGEPNSTRMIGNEFSDLVVELPYGTCKEKNISIGDKIQLILE